MIELAESIGYWFMAFPWERIGGMSFLFGLFIGTLSCVKLYEDQENELKKEIRELKRELIRRYYYDK